MNQKLEEKLIDKYWFLQYDKDPLTTGLFFGFECGDGWYDLLDELMGKLDKLISEKFPELKTSEYPFRVTQIKEKFGTLRFYTSGAYDEIFDLIEVYEVKSAYICEWCGKPARTRDYNGWYITLCNEHWNEYQKKRITD